MQSNRIKYFGSISRTGAHPAHLQWGYRCPQLGSTALPRNSIICNPNRVYLLDYRLSIWSKVHSVRRNSFSCCKTCAESRVLITRRRMWLEIENQYGSQFWGHSHGCSTKPISLVKAHRRCSLQWDASLSQQTWLSTLWQAYKRVGAMRRREWSNRLQPL